VKTIATCVEEIIRSSPFLEEGLSRQIINFSALAKDLNQPISEMLKKPNLSAISIYLPKGNSKVSGLYYQIFKRLAWDKITLYEVVSTTNEFTIGWTW